MMQVGSYTNVDAHGLLARTVAPMITDIVNKSLAAGAFPTQPKSGLVTPLLKKPNLDSDSLRNDQPVSNVTFLSKVLEKAVSTLLISYMSQNCLFLSYQK